MTSTFMTREPNDSTDDAHRDMKEAQEASRELSGSRAEPAQGLLLLAKLGLSALSLLTALMWLIGHSYWTARLQSDGLDLWAVGLSVQRLLHPSQLSQNVLANSLLFYVLLKGNELGRDDAARAGGGSDSRGASVFIVLLVLYAVLVGALRIYYSQWAFLTAEFVGIISGWMAYRSLAASDDYWRIFGLIVLLGLLTGHAWYAGRRDARTSNRATVEVHDAHTGCGAKYVLLLETQRGLYLKGANSESSAAVFIPRSQLLLVKYGV